MSQFLLGIGNVNDEHADCSTHSVRRLSRALECIAIDASRFLLICLYWPATMLMIRTVIHSLPMLRGVRCVTVYNTSNRYASSMLLYQLPRPCWYTKLQAVCFSLLHYIRSTRIVKSFVLFITQSCFVQPVNASRWRQSCHAHLCRFWWRSLRRLLSQSANYTFKSSPFILFSLQKS